MPSRSSITDIPGLLVGHAQDEKALTGCTVVLTPGGAVCGVDVRGSAPGTRETDLLAPGNLVERVHAVLLSGGSAFGLDAAGGVMRWLEERGHGFDTGVARVPIVPAAVLFDLALGRADRRPDAGMGYQACLDARPGPEPAAEGNVGAGTGASAGKLFGPLLATKTGIGSSCLEGAGGLLVGAIVAVNAFGDVRDPASGAILAGTRNPSGGWVDTAAALTGEPGRALLGFGVGDSRSSGTTSASGAPGVPGGTDAATGGTPAAPGRNTTIGVVATNAILDRAQARKVAQMAHDGLALTISPVHTMFDGDALFALSYGQPPVTADVSVVGTLAVRAVAAAVVRAALAARRAGGLPSAAEVRG